MGAELVYPLEFVDWAEVLVCECSYQSVAVESEVSWVQFLFYGKSPASDNLEDRLHVFLFAHVFKV